MKKVEEVMSRDPACCVPGTTLEVAARMMVDHDCGEIPVVNDLETRKPVGVITDRDICVRTVAVGKNPLALTVSDCMSVPCITVELGASLRECLEIMEDNQIRRIPVVDQNSRLCGIVSQADLVMEVEGDLIQDVLREISMPSEGPSRFQM